MDVAQRWQWRWLHRGMSLAMRMPSTRSSHRDWYLIQPLCADRAATRAVLRASHQPIPARTMHIFHVRHLQGECRALLQIIEGGADVRCLDEFFAYGDEQLSERLEKRGLSVATFYPLTTTAARENSDLREAANA